MPARTLYLHVGHGKTGSSYLQSTCARSAGPLERAGIVFPLFPGWREAAAGGVSSGNGALLNADPSGLPAVPAGQSVLYSGEKLFAALQTAPFRDKLHRVAERHGAQRIAILLFIRNPIAHLASAYQQAIKRGGEALDIDAFAPRFEVPAMVRRFLDGVRPEPGISLTVRNYSVHRERLHEVFAEWLGVPVGTLSPPDRPVVNRSLTPSELAVQKLVNRALGPSGRLVADRLCERLPGIPVTPLAPSAAAQDEVLGRMAPAMRAVNAVIEPADHYVADRVPPNPGEADVLQFGAEQLAVIIDGLAGEIARLRGPSAGR